jgi:hypothetical protein
MTVEINHLQPDVWEHRVLTTAPPTAVFDYIADFKKHIEWERQLQTVEPLNRRMSTAGGQYLKTYGTAPTGFVARIFARGLRVTCNVTELVRPKRIAWNQYCSHSASEPTSFQTVDLMITPNQMGSLMVLTRRFTGMDASSAELVAMYMPRLDQLLQGLPPEVRAAGSRLAGGSTGRPGLFSSSDDVVRRVLDGYPSRGPGPTSLLRLNAILDGGEIR